VILLKTPICSFDAKTGVLCGRCEGRLRSGKLTQAELEASMILAKLAQHNQEIDKFTLVTAFKVDEDFVLVLRSSDLMSIRSNKDIYRKIEQQFNNKVWFVEADTTERRFVENLLFPTRLLSINLIWLPDGHKLTRVILDSKDQSGPRSNIQKIQRIAKKIKDIELLVEYNK
jgi:transcription antitermination factor NusA-like protein